MQTVPDASSGDRKSSVTNGRESGAGDYLSWLEPNIPMHIGQLVEYRCSWKNCSLDEIAMKSLHTDLYVFCTADFMMVMCL